MAAGAAGADGSAGRQAAALAAYDHARRAGAPAAATRALLAALEDGACDVTLGVAQSLILRADTAAAATVLAAAHAAHPDSPEVTLAWAGMLRQTGQPLAAEAPLRALLARHPGDAAAAFLLAAILRESGRLAAVAGVLRALFQESTADVGQVIRAIELLQECQRQPDAAAIVELAFTRGATDPRLHAYAGMLDVQLGEFSRARAHYAAALAGDPRAMEWNLPLGLAALQRYATAGHPDFALFRRTLARADLPPRARADVLFALAKASDDVGDYAQAAGCAREANAIAHAASSWSRKSWRRMLGARLAAPAPRFGLPETDAWTPIFIVGVPRSGTTLVAALLARHPDVCNRGELPWLAELAPHLRGLQGDGAGAAARAAAIYAAQCRQDDSSARWFIDKQPQNLLHVDLAAALWPHARIVYCVRGARDTALSLWLQSFLDPAQGYAYDLGDIAAVIHGCAKLGARWRARYPEAIHVVRYEELVAAPDQVMAQLGAWLGLPAVTAPAGPTGAINTASVWQARQPVYTRSVGRWRHYAGLVPELLRLPER